MSSPVPEEGDRAMANESMAVKCSDDVYRDEVSGTATQCSQPDSNCSITVPSLEIPLSISKVPVGGPGNPLPTKTISLKNDGSSKALGDDSHEDSGVTAAKAQVEKLEELYANDAAALVEYHKEITELKKLSDKEKADLEHKNAENAKLQEFTVLTGHQSGFKGLNRQDSKDHPNSLLSKSNEESHIETSAGCKVDAKAVDSSLREKRKWKRNTEDGISQESIYLFLPSWHIPKEMLSYRLGKIMVFIHFCGGTTLWSIRKKVRVPPECRWIASAIFFILPVVTATNAPCPKVVYVELGREGVLPCTYQNYSVVGWTYEPNHLPFVYMENGIQKGQKYDSGEFAILENGSLIIKNVEMKHAGSYTSLYVPQQNGEHNYLEVELRVLPVAPYPVIDGCHSKLSDCVLTVPRDGINCSVQVFPGISGTDLNLTMESETAVLHLVDGPTITPWNGKTFLKSSFSYEIEKSAGTFEIECRVEGLPPIDPITKATVNVEVQGKLPTGVWILIIIISMVLSGVVSFLLAKRKGLRKCTGAIIPELRCRTM